MGVEVFTEFACAACNELSDFSSSGTAEVKYAVIAAGCTLTHRHVQEQF